jgi:hypothetical protein
MGMRLRHAMAEALMFTAEACDLLAELLDPQRAPHAYSGTTVAQPDPPGVPVFDFRRMEVRIDGEVISRDVNGG